MNFLLFLAPFSWGTQKREAAAPKVSGCFVGGTCAVREEPGKQKPRSCRAQELARSSAQENERQKKATCRTQQKFGEWSRPTAATTLVRGMCSKCPERRTREAARRRTSSEAVSNTTENRDNGQKAPPYPIDISSELLTWLVGNLSAFCFKKHGFFYPCQFEKRTI